MKRFLIWPKHVWVRYRAHPQKAVLAHLREGAHIRLPMVGVFSLLFQIGTMLVINNNLNLVGPKIVCPHFICRHIFMLLQLSSFSLLLVESTLSCNVPITHLMHHVMQFFVMFTMSCKLCIWVSCMFALYQKGSLHVSYLTYKSPCARAPLDL